MSSCNRTTRRQLADGEFQAWTLFFAEHREVLFRIASFKTRDAAEADDVVQAVFLAAFMAFRSGEIRNLASIRAWLMQRLHWVISEQVYRPLKGTRRGGRRAIATDALPERFDPRADPATIGQARELQGRVWETLGKLQIELQQPLILRYFEDLNYQDMAEILGCSVSTVRRRVAKGKEELRRWLKDDGNPQGRSH